LDAIAASVVGGASLDGGEGSVIGTVPRRDDYGDSAAGRYLLGVNSFILEIITFSDCHCGVADKLRK
jgi:ribose transport system permease protein